MLTMNLKEITLFSEVAIQVHVVRICFRIQMWVQTSRPVSSESLLLKNEV